MKSKGKMKSKAKEKALEHYHNQVGLIPESILLRECLDIAIKETREEMFNWIWDNSEIQIKEGFMMILFEKVEELKRRLEAKEDEN